MDVKCNCDYVFDKIEYCKRNRIDRLQAFNKSEKEIFLYKNSDLSIIKIFIPQEFKEIKFSIEYILH